VTTNLQGVNKHSHDTGYSRYDLDMVTNFYYPTLLAIVLMSPFGDLRAMDDSSASVETLLIDDFQSGDGQAVFGTQWSGFSDRVMGGISDMDLGYQRLDDDRLSLRLQGQVRLENNGGFIQARLPLEIEGRRFDASDWEGIQVTARAKPGAYYIHLRTRATWLPWQYYGAQIPLDGDPDWVTAQIPFSAFEGESTRRSFDSSSLKSIAVVAFGEAFEADLEVIELSFYRMAQ